MNKILQYILPFEYQQSFSDSSLNERYKEWDRPTRQIQVFAVTFLTAILYLIFTLIDKSWATEQVQLLMMKIHLFIIIPILLTISYLAYKKQFYKYVMIVLAIYPIISMSCHAYIASQLTNQLTFLTEGYLGVLWIFIVSGMPFRYATISAGITAIILLVSAFYFINETDAYVMYVFWILCSFSFGFLGALIFDSSRKAIFLSQQALHRLAITDPLTGLFNRNQLNIVLTQEIERSVRYNQTFGFLLIDIDHFKDINDTYGHDIGDKVLNKTASILSKSLRENDTLVRWGGEEFVIIALEVDQHSLINLSDKLRNAIEAELYLKAIKVTVSIGATLFKQKDTQDLLLSRADKALYIAKENGRNTTTFVE